MLFTLLALTRQCDLASGQPFCIIQRLLLFSNERFNRTGGHHLHQLIQLLLYQPFIRVHDFAAIAVVYPHLESARRGKCPVGPIAPFTLRLSSQLLGRGDVG
ncbi:Uncharacterized membrane protein YccC [Pseudomonas syringae pv. actinidiae]|uniref:Uncharacterized membrane protein YccC n=1 Tax=Pseudomonas syringae pv. actinidiae TaxID=103796 RepID=A0AAN4QCL6_PSESF|nr:Uncharacterized membrane protein YccC [Pseudomonas syringae pv. actinidiae]